MSIHPCVGHLSICLSHCLLLNHWAKFNQTCYITSPHVKGVGEQHFFFLCTCHPSIGLSCYLLLNLWAEFNQTCYITSPHGKSVQEQHYFSVRPWSVHLSIKLSPPKPLGRIQPNLLHHFPSWLGCARATLFFHVSICPCIRHPSICLSCYLLLNYRADFNQTCYITFPHGVCKSNICFLCVQHPSICQSC